MIDKKTFKKAIAVSLERAGFVKRGESWYLEGRDIIVITTLYKSNFGDLYYMDIDFWIKALNPDTIPQSNYAHLGFRVESLFPERRALIDAGCSLDQPSVQPLNEFSAFIESELAPFLRECTEAAKLRELMSQGRLKRGFVSLAARYYLGDQLPPWLGTEQTK